jgi:ligand-binding SRPBCC domain-containing protein
MAGMPLEGCPLMIRIEETTIIAAPIERCFDLSRSVEVHLLANIHSGEQAIATSGATSGLVGLGQQVTWRAKHFGVWQNLTSETTALEAPTYFQVTMIRGIFRSMQADHWFRTLPSGATEMRDDFRVAAPLGLLGLIAEALFLRRYMLALLRERNAVIKRVAESGEWRKYLPIADPPGHTAK